MKNKKKSSKKEPDSEVTTEIELIFDGNTVKGVWYHPELKDVICGLCGKNCEIPCHNVNAYCG